MSLLVKILSLSAGWDLWRDHLLKRNWTGMAVAPWHPCQLNSCATANWRESMQRIWGSLQQMDSGCLFASSYLRYVTCRSAEIEEKCINDALFSSGPGQPGGVRHAESISYRLLYCLCTDSFLMAVWQPTNFWTELNQRRCDQGSPRKFIWLYQKRAKY